MPLEPFIEHGVQPSYGLQQEEGMLVESVSVTAERDEVARKGAERTTEYSRWEDPRLTGEIQGRPRRNAQGNLYGLGNVHPGVALDLANIADGMDIHGFNINDDNVTIIGNPKRESSDSDGTKVTIPFTYRPFIAKAVAG